MSKKTQAPEAPPKSPFWSSVQILLVIVLIAVVPLVLRQIDVDPETLKLMGRGAAAVGVFLIILALIKQVTKLAIVLAIAGIVFAVLVSEGVIDLPRLLS